MFLFSAKSAHPLNISSFEPLNAPDPQSQRELQATQNRLVTITAVKCGAFVRPGWRR
jgi:hypothetical protein